MAASEVNPRCYMDFKQGDVLLGRIIIEIFADTVPKTAANFIALCNGKQRNESGVRLYYKNCIVHRVIESFMIQMGDFTKGDGTGGCSVYGKHFDDENFAIKHSKYYLSMANAGKNTNGSQFFICTDECSHLNGKHVVFGKVIDGMDIIDEIDSVETDARDRPLKMIKISKCGQLVRVKQSVVDNTMEQEEEEENESEDESENESDTDTETTSSDEDENMKEKNKKKKNREFHLNSVHYVDETGRVRKGKGNFRHVSHYRSRTRNRRNDYEYRKYDEQKKVNDKANNDEIRFAQPMEFETIDNDEQTVSSMVSIYSVDELYQQDHIKHRKTGSSTTPWSRSQSPSRHSHK